MSVTSEKSKITLTSPGAFAASLPALVGFHPAQSLVAVYLKAGLVQVTMRLDLPESLTEAADYVASTGTRVEADEVILAIYAAKADDLPHRDGIEAITSACAADDIAVKDAMLITGGRWWSYLCQDADCCPPEGQPIPEDTSLLEAERIGTGQLAVAESRDQIVARYAPRPELMPGRAARKQAQAILEVPVAERAQQAWDAVKMLSTNPDMPTKDAGQLLRARLQIAVGDVRVRDFIMTHIALSEANTDALVDTVVQAALTAPVRLRPRIAGAAAALLAACGESSIAVDCLLDLAEGESLAELVRVSKDAVVPPKTLRQAFRDAFPQVVAQLREAKAITA